MLRLYRIQNYIQNNAKFSVEIKLMNINIKNLFLFAVLSILILSCSNPKSNAHAEPENQSSSGKSEIAINEKLKEDSAINEDSANTNERTEISDEKRGCQPAKVPVSDGLPKDANMNEALAKDTSVNGLNKILENMAGDFAVDTEQKPYFFEGDFNGDGCQDIAIIVGATDSYHSDVKDINQAASNTNVDAVKTNLRTGATLMPEEVKKRGAVMPKNLKSESDRALVIIHGGEKSWNWKYGGEGRIYLLLDSVITEKDCGGCAGSLISKTSNKNGAECFPKTAKGEGIFMGGEEGGKLIYFDGKQYKWTQCGD